MTYEHNIIPRKIKTEVESETIVVSVPNKPDITIRKIETEYEEEIFEEAPEILVVNGEDGTDGYTPIKGVDYFDGKDGKKGDKGKDGKTPTKTELKAFIKEMFPEDKLLEKLIKKLPKAEVDSIEIGEDNNGQWIAKNGKKMYIKKQFSVGAGMSTGVYDFIALRDAPDSYVGQAGKFPRVKETEDGLEFADVATATPTLQEVTDEGNTTTNQIGIQITPEAPLHIASDIGTTTATPTSIVATLIQFTPSTEPNSGGATQSAGHLYAPTGAYANSQSGSSSYNGGDAIDYRITAYSGSSTFAAVSTIVSATIFNTGDDVDIGWTDNTSGTETIAGYIIERQINGGGYVDGQDVGNVTSFLDTSSGWSGIPTTPVYPDFIANGNSYSYEGWGFKTVNGYTIYSLAQYFYSFTDDSSGNPYVISHSLSGASDSTKIINTTQGTGAIGDTLTEDTTNFTAGNTSSPNSYGYQSDGTSLSIAYDYYGYLAGVYSTGHVSTSTTDPNDGNYYYVSLALTPDDGKIIKNGSAGLLTSSTPIIDDGITSFGSGTTVTPNAVYPNTEILESHGSTLSDKATQVWRSMDGNYARAEFQNSSDTRLGYIESTSTGLKISGASGAASIQLGTTIAQTATAFSADITVPDEVYSVSWNGSLEAPTKNAIYDKIQTIVPYTGATQDIDLGSFGIELTEVRANSSAGILLEANNGTDIALLGVGNTANGTWYGSHNFNAATQDTIAAFVGSGKTLSSLALATYPSLAELSYVKGITSAIQTQLNGKQATLVSGTNIKTINSTSLLGSGDIAISASPAGSDTQVQYNNAGAFGADSLFTFNGDALGIGTATPRSSRLGISAPSIAGAVAGTGTLAPSQIFDDGIVTGTGTLFLSEVEKGDLLMNNADNLAGMVTRVVSDTQLWYVGLGVGFFGGAYKIVKGVASVRDSSGNISWVEASPTSYNEQSGAMNYGGRIFSGGYTMFANNSVPNSGIIIKNQSADGQMRIKHIQSGAYLNFQPSGANITASGLTIAGNSTWATPLYIGMGGYSGGETGLYVDRTGTGTGQTMYLTTRIYAINGASPKLELSANGLDFGRRDGSTWNEGIDAITLSMDATTGKWSIGTFGTTTPTGATTRLDFATVGETFGIKTGTNAAMGTATLSGGTITINTTAITANTMIVLSPGRTSTANMGVHYESARTAGTSFTITSTNASDDSTFDWHFVEKL